MPDGLLNESQWFQVAAVEASLIAGSSQITFYRVLLSRILI
jgi:hypothetical protein